MRHITRKFEVNTMVVCIKKNSIDIDSSTCILPKYIFDTLKLSITETYTIHFGLSTQDTLINFSEVDEKNMYLSKNLFGELSLLEDITLNIWKTNKDIFLGPVIGILVNAGRLRASRKNLSSFIRQQIRASLAEKCMGYFFSVNGVDWANKKIKGFTFIPKLNKYAYHWFPLPNVLYDRILKFNTKEKPLVTLQRKRLTSNPNIKLINSFNMIGKWAINKALVKYADAKQYLPETIIYSSFDDVISMLEIYDLIFIKSIFGTQGTEVLSIEKLNNKYKLNYYQKGAKDIFLDSVNEVKEFVNKYIGSKKFIIQQGLKLLTYKGHSMDIRIFIMKNASGKWESIFKGARIASGDFLLTNIHTGGVYAFYEQLYPQLKEQYSSIKLPTSAELDEASIMIATYIERELGACGEFGIDIGIDTTGRIWLIEANDKPGKRLESKSLDIFGNHTAKVIPLLYKGSMKHNKILPQALGIFKYAKFLTGTNKI
jgi:hypothetical protein